MSSFPNPISSTIEPPRGEVLPKDVERYGSSLSHSVKEWFIGRPVSEVIQDMNGNIWFSDSEQFYGRDSPANWIGRLNPLTGEVKIWTLPSGNRISDLEIDSKGYIWIVERISSSIVRFDSISETFRYYSVPSGSWPFDMTFSPDGNIWVTITVGNRVAEFNPATERWVRSFVVPDVLWTAGILYDSNGLVWITSTLPCKAPFIYDTKTGSLRDISIDGFCHDRELMERDGALIAPWMLQKPSSFIEFFSNGSYIEHPAGITTGKWIDYSSLFDSILGGYDDYFYIYSLKDEILKNKVDIPGSGIVSVQLSYDGKSVLLSERDKKSIGVVPILDFEECFIPITESEDRAQEVEINSCLIDNLPIFHFNLFSVASNPYRPLRHRVFAISYLFEKPELLKNDEWNWLRSEECVNVLKDGIYAEGGTTFVAEKAIFALLRNEDSQEAGDLIREILADENHPHIIEVLRRHATGLYSGGWLGNILFDEAFVSPASEFSRGNAMWIFPVINIEGVPFERFISYLSDGGVSDEIKKMILTTLEEILYLHRKEEIPNELRDILGGILIGLRLNPELEGIAIRCLGILRGYEDYLLEELKYGEDMPELLFALGEGGDVSTGWKLLEIAKDENIEPSRRVRAGRAAFAIGRREINLDLLGEVFNLFPYAKEMVLNINEKFGTRLEALLFASGITSPSGFTTLIKDIFEEGDEILYSEAMRLAVYWADCDAIRVIETIEKRYEEELIVLNTYVDTITSFIREKSEEISKKLDEIIIKIEGGIKNKKGKWEDGMLKKLQDGLERVPEGDVEIRGKVGDIISDTKDMLSYAKELTAIPLTEGDIKKMKEILQDIYSEVTSTISLCQEREYEESVEKLEETKEKADEIFEKLDEMEEKFSEVKEKVEEVVQESGFSDIFELFQRREYVKNIFYGSVDNRKIMEDRCKAPSEIIPQQPEGGSPYTMVDGYVYDETGKPLAGITFQVITSYTRICIFWFCVNVPSGLSSPITSDSYGYFKPAPIPSPLTAHLFIDPAIDLNYGYLKFYSGPFVLYGKYISGKSMRIKIYLPFGQTPDYDADGLSDKTEKWLLAYLHTPVYYFHKDERWYPTDPFKYYVKRSYGLYDKDLKVQKLPPTEDGFYKMGEQPWKDHKVYTKSVLAHTFEGLPLFHVLPFPANRITAAGGTYSFIPRTYKIQYHLFHDYSLWPWKIEACVGWGLVCMDVHKKEETHFADWEWICAYVLTGMSPIMDYIYKVGFHQHGVRMVRTYYGTKKINVFIAKNSHASFPGVGTYDLKGDVYQLLDMGLDVLLNVVGSLFRLLPSPLVGVQLNFVGKDYTSSDKKWTPLVGVNIDDYSTDRVARVIYNYSGRWGKDTDSPGGPRTGPDGRDYYSYEE